MVVRQAMQGPGKAYSMKVITFKQGPLGHFSAKWTSAMTNLDLVHLRKLTKMSSSAETEGERECKTWNSKYLSRWAWGLNMAIVAALASHLEKDNTVASDRPRVAAGHGQGKHGRCPDHELSKQRWSRQEASCS
jgi:hypothetical protein